MGRPSKWSPEFREEAVRMCALSASLSRFGGTATRSLSGADPAELRVRQQAPESKSAR